MEEPNGTVNRQIPRVERHTVNTEVQLTNLELREISRFETNARLGTPSQRVGGIPIIKELPLLKEIPLLGYYSKRGKSAGTRQESLIFAQTTMYPTVSDIMDLLVDVPARSGLDREPPPYLIDKHRHPDR